MTKYDHLKDRLAQIDDRIVKLKREREEVEHKMFLEHLKQTSMMVSKWPTWKRGALTPPLSTQMKEGEQKGEAGPL